MEKMVIDKEYLKRCSSLKIVFENCDVYEISADDIADIYCEMQSVSNRKDEYFSDKGFIKIAAIASDTAECLALQEYETDIGHSCRLKARLEMCNGCADMTSFSLIGKSGRAVNIQVQYDPLEDIIHGNEIEFSNCPSFDTDACGNMFIAFGGCSKQPKRRDNDYVGLIAGWKDAFGEYDPAVLKVRITSLNMFGGEKKNVEVGVKLCDRFRRKKSARFMFVDCRDIGAEMFFPQRGDCDIIMSKMADGNIYVGFYGLGVDFVCTSAFEYCYYCNYKKSDCSGRA